MSKELTFGYSPCPNDTFMFNAIARGDVKVSGHRMKPVLHDVETLNDMAFVDELDVTKLSFYAWLKLKKRYQLLNSGSAMGFGCGPVLIANANIHRSELKELRIVLPGKWTTAHLLFKLWAPEATQKTFVPYDRIFETLKSGIADCGVIIHESRFTFESEGFVPVVDLGQWWEKKTGLPIPLGCIAAKRELGDALIKQIDNAVNRSIKTANANPDQTIPYIQEHAQEMDEKVLHSHISTFVNDFSLNLPKEGQRAIQVLEKMAKEAGAL